MRRSLEAGSSGKPDVCALIMENDQTLGAHVWRGTQAKAEPDGAMRDHQVMFAFRYCDCNRLKFWR